MIAKELKKVRKGDLTKIENYYKAVADKTQTWICHHRLELTLDGEFAHSQEDLERMGMYYNRPYFELIFLTRAEHTELHKKGQKLSEEHKKKISEANKGRVFSEEHKNKLSKAHKGMKGVKYSEESKKRMSEAMKGKKLGEETRKKIGKARKNKPFPKSDFGKKYFEHYGYSNAENPKQYVREHNWYYTHNHKCSWEKEA